MFWILYLAIGYAVLRKCGISEGVKQSIVELVLVAQVKLTPYLKRILGTNFEPFCAKLDEYSQIAKKILFYIRVGSKFAIQYLHGKFLVLITRLHRQNECQTPVFILQEDNLINLTPFIVEDVIFKDSDLARCIIHAEKFYNCNLKSGIIIVGNNAMNVSKVFDSYENFWTGDVIRQGNPFKWEPVFKSIQNQILGNEIFHDLKNANLDSGLESPDSGLESPDSGLESPDSGLESHDSGLESHDSGLESPHEETPIIPENRKSDIDEFLHDL